ncbi:MBL fold metallo-hydrolase [Chloroflexota bacterium]
MTFLPRIRRLIYSTSEIIPDVFQLTIRAINVILIVEEEITLVDTGLKGSSPQIIDFINQLGRSPEEISLIILTHNHPDHIGGLEELRQFTPTKIAIHKADNDTGSGRPNPGGFGRIFPLRVLISVVHSAFATRFGDANIELSGGEILKPLGGLEVIHTPGHTPGSISLYSAKNRLMIVGDAIRNRKRALQLPPKMISTDVKEAVDSIRKIASLDFNILCTGHGRPLLNDAHDTVQALVDSL